MDPESVAARPREVGRLERVGLWVAVVVGWISLLNPRHLQRRRC